MSFLFNINQNLIKEFVSCFSVRQLSSNTKSLTIWKVISRPSFKRLKLLKTNWDCSVMLFKWQLSKRFSSLALTQKSTISSLDLETDTSNDFRFFSKLLKKKSKNTICWRQSTDSTQISQMMPWPIWKNKNRN
jgi:hypothetical protein